MSDPVVSDYASWLTVLETLKAVHQEEVAAKKAAEDEARRKEDALKGAELKKVLLMFGLDTGELLTGVYTAPDRVQFYLASDTRDLIVSPWSQSMLSNRVPLVLHNDYSEAARAARLMDAISEARRETNRRNLPK